MDLSDFCLFYLFIFLQTCITAKRLLLPWWRRLAQSLKGSQLNGAPRRINTQTCRAHYVLCSLSNTSNSELLYMCMCWCRHRLARWTHTEGKREVVKDEKWERDLQLRGDKSRRTEERGGSKRRQEKRSSKQSGRIKIVIVDGAQCDSLEVTLINDAH